MGRKDSNRNLGTVNIESLNNAVRKKPSDDWQTKVSEAGAGGVVVVEKGDHPAPSSQVDLPDDSDGTEGISIIGHGKASKVKVPDGGTLFSGAAANNYDTDNNISGHTIQGLFFYQDSWSSRGLAAVDMDGMLKGHIRGNWFKNLVYGIRVKSASGGTQGNWANHIVDNEAELVQRFIWLDESHDSLVRGNHAEGISDAASISAFDDAEGDAVGIGLDHCMNMVVADNAIEGIKDDGGAGKGMLVRRPQNNFQISNNYVTASDITFQPDWPSDPGSNESELQLSNNFFIIDGASGSSSASNTTVAWSVSAHRGKINDIGGTFDELHIQINGLRGDNGNCTIKDSSINDGRVVIQGVQPGAGATTGGIIQVEGDFSEVHISDFSAGFVTVRGGSTVDDVTVTNGTCDDFNLFFVNATITRCAVSDLTIANTSVDEIVEVRSAATVSHLSVANCQLENTGTATTIDGTNTNLITSNNITDAT